MKKTLFALAALTLCGTAFAATYNTNDPSLNLNSFKKYNEAITLNVNKTVTFGDFSLFLIRQPLVLNFVSSNTFSSTDSFEIDGWGSISVTGDSTAATSWESKLLENAGTAVAITLVSSTAENPTFNMEIATFMGKSAGQTITLGNTMLTYRGFRNVDDMGGGESMDDVKSYLSDNQVFLVGASSMSNGGGLYLVGKVAAPATPEPATATLSLLALAGLASRRRRK